MGDVDGGDARGLADFSDLGSEVVAEFGIEVGEGLVEEKHGGSDDEGAGEGDALLLAAGELVGFAGGVLVYLDGVEGVGDALFLLVGRGLSDVEAEGDVGLDGHVWPEGVGLEDHAGVSEVWGEVGDVACALVVFEGDGAGGWVDESGDHSEECGFAAAAGSEEEEEFAGVDGERGVIDGGGCAAGGCGEGFGEVVDADGGGHVVRNVRVWGGDGVE